MAFAAALGRTADQSVDETADFEARLQPHYAEAVRLAYGMLRNSALAEDASQEAALRAWRSRRNLREDSELRPWFLAIVANCCRDVWRSSQECRSLRSYQTLVHAIRHVHHTHSLRPIRHHQQHLHAQNDRHSSSRTPLMPKIPYPLLAEGMRIQQLRSGQTAPPLLSGQALRCPLGVGGGREGAW